MWLHLPPTCCPSRQESECSTKPLTSRLLAWVEKVARSATWRGKPRLPRLWLAAWRKDHFIRHLSGVTLPLSTAERGVALWMFSLRASRANPTALPGSAQGMRTSDRSEVTMGRLRTVSESSKSVLPPWSSLRTSGPGLLGESSTSANSARSYHRWVIESKRRSLSLRQILAHHMKGNESSSWPTARSTQAGESFDPKGGRSLHNMSKQWPTARAEDSESVGLRISRGTADTLTAVIKDWSTPQAHDRTAPGKGTQVHGGGRRRDLPTETSQWQTPAAQQFASGPETGHQLQLKQQAEVWQTPGSDSFRSRGGGRKDEQGLDQQARSLPSARPTAEAVNYDKPSTKSSPQTSIGHESRRFSRLHPTLRIGTTSSKQTHTSPLRLNPAFVNWLQGNAWWWTHPAPTSFGPREIRWWRCRLRQRLSFLLAVLGSSKYRKYT